MNTGSTVHFSRVPTFFTGHYEPWYYLSQKTGYNSSFHLRRLVDLVARPSSQFNFDQKFHIQGLFFPLNIPRVGSISNIFELARIYIPLLAYTRARTKQQKKKKKLKLFLERWGSKKKKSKISLTIENLGEIRVKKATINAALLRNTF